MFSGSAACYVYVCILHSGATDVGAGTAPGETVVIFLVHSARDMNKSFPSLLVRKASIDMSVPAALQYVSNPSPCPVPVPYHWPAHLPIVLSG